jgi:hypothetical protein
MADSKWPKPFTTKATKSTKNALLAGFPFVTFVVRRIIDEEVFSGR